MRKLKARECGGLSKGEWDILPGTLAPGFLMSFLPSVEVLTLRIKYWWKCKRLFLKNVPTSCASYGVFSLYSLTLGKCWAQGRCFIIFIEKFNFT